MRCPILRYNTKPMMLFISKIMPKVPPKQYKNKIVISVKILTPRINPLMIQNGIAINNNMIKIILLIFDIIVLFIFFIIPPNFVVINSLYVKN